MAAIVIVGAQWGDEGKGKATDDALLRGEAFLREQLDFNTKITRPREIYTGETLRKVTPRAERA